MAWTESQAVSERHIGRAGGLASRSGTAQHLGRGAARRVLEVRGAAKDRGQQARLFCFEGQQFFSAAGKG